MISINKQENYNAYHIGGALEAKFGEAVLGLFDTIAGIVFRVFRRCFDGDETAVRSRWKQKETERDNRNRMRKRHVTLCGNIKTF